MSKYDFEIDLSQSTSTGIILSKIGQGSVVLEFGCAAGRMTRYMKESQGCQVYIVECDKTAFDKAKVYAEDGLCDDILNYQWVKKFLDIEFDVIIFADVLEHLTEPELVLEQASRLLKENGSIFISLPNITHNDILLKAYEERFDYTKTGILDDTHVHFWGLKNIEKIPEKTNLGIKRIEGTYCATGHTEQYENAEFNGNLLLKNLLKERACGEVYQFVIELVKNKDISTNFQIRNPFIKSHIYLDTGNGFCEEEVIAFDAEYTEEGYYKAHYIIEDTMNVKAVRFDPLELQGCILRNITITQGEQVLKLSSLGGVPMQNGWYLPGPDPLVYADITSDGEAITVDAEVLLPGKDFLELVQETLIESHRALERFNVDYANLADAHQALKDVHQSLIDVNEVLKGEIQNLRNQKKDALKQIDELLCELESLRVSLGGYIILANNKDRYALELEKEKQSLKREFGETVKYYEGLKVVKIYKLAARIWRGIKWRIKRLIGKGEHEWSTK